MFYLVLLPFLLFVAAPLTMLAGNHVDLAYLNLSLFSIFLSAQAVFFAILLLLIDAPVQRLAPAAVGTGLRATARFFCFVILLAAYVLPLAEFKSFLEPETFDSNALNVLLVLGLAGVLAVVAGGKGADALRLFVVVYLLMNVFMNVWQIVDERGGRADRVAAQSGFSAQKNVLVLSFDGVPGLAMNRLLSEPKAASGHADTLRDFHWYPNVRASSPTTLPSIVGELTGNHDFKSLAEDESAWVAAERDRMLTNVLAEQGFSVAVYDAYGHGFKGDAIARRGEMTRGIFQATDLQRHEIETLFHATLSRVGTAVVARSFYASEYLRRLRDRIWQTLVAALDIDATQAPAGLLARLPQGVMGPFGMRLALAAGDFYRWVEDVHVSASIDRPTAHFLHFSFTHSPVMFDRSCRFRADDRAWFQAYGFSPDGLSELAHCALNAASEAIRMLKENGIYDETLIVLKSDHGKSWFFYPPGSVGSEQLRGHPWIGVDRYYPFLMVKGWGQRQAQLSVVPAPVLLDDLAGTLCGQLGASIDCAAYAGADLLQDELSDPERHRALAAEPAYVNLPLNPESTHRFDDFETVEFTRGDIPPLRRLSDLDVLPVTPLP